MPSPVAEVWQTKGISQVTVNYSRPSVNGQNILETNREYYKQLAEKCGTTKTYISRIENNASDIRLSTLMQILSEGFGGHLSLSVGLSA
jgi:transcriptional regulator with XRE-family HTH domain